MPVPIVSSWMLSEYARKRPDRMNAQELKRFHFGKQLLNMWVKSDTVRELPPTDRGGQTREHKVASYCTWRLFSTFGHY